MDKETIKVIKRNLTFEELPKDIQKGWIDSMATDMIESFDEGVHNKKSATIDAKQYYLDWNSDRKYVLFHSSFHGIQAEEQDRFDN
tara:strand:+ start:224 stop:481 length:258 start_codon:yes stop_codon:yes gene_type:complete